ncbi:hypothetical protein P3S67_006332 [Capsicum chacoense]
MILLSWLSPSPLFNPALYPHKPTPAVVANRVRFTDALLALDLMEYNTDWNAIQQRYLPCKSEHQAVRRMKHSPLIAEEVARIEKVRSHGNIHFYRIIISIVSASYLHGHDQARPEGGSSLIGCPCGSLLFLIEIFLVTPAVAHC